MAFLGTEVDKFKRRAPGPQFAGSSAPRHYACGLQTPRRLLALIALAMISSLACGPVAGSATSPGEPEWSVISASGPRTESSPIVAALTVTDLKTRLRESDATWGQFPDWRDRSGIALAVALEIAVPCAATSAVSAVRTTAKEVVFEVGARDNGCRLGAAPPAPAYSLVVLFGPPFQNPIRVSATTGGRETATGRSSRPPRP